MRKISFETIKLNSRLTDFADFKDKIINYNKSVRCLSSIKGNYAQDSNTTISMFLK